MDNRRLRDAYPEINEHFNLAKKELDDLPKVNGVVVDGSLVEFVNCPICNSDKIDQIFVKYGFLLSECRDCTHVFIRNRLKEDFLLKKYAGSNADKIDRKVQKSDYHQESLK